MKIKLAAFFVVFEVVAVCKDARTFDPYDTHEWFVMRDALQYQDKPPDIDRGIVACSFNDIKGCEHHMQRPLKSGTKDEQWAAHWALGSLYHALGRSRMALPHYEALNRLGSPDDTEVPLRAYAQFPDMFVATFHATSLPCDRWDGHLSVPVTINGVPGIYVLDTGADLSIIEESEAKRLGMCVLTIKPFGVHNVAGNVVPVAKIGIAEHLDLGGIQLRNVPFLVSKDQQGIPDRGGFLGIQVLLACRTIRWNASGIVQLGFRHRGRRDIRRSNLCLDGRMPHVQAEFNGQKLDFALDTGGDTYLLERFAKDFPAIVKECGQQGKLSLAGIGDEEGKEFAATVLPQLELRLGKEDLAIRPARIVQKEGWGHGVLGIDFFKDAHAVTLDFRTMMLTVE